MHLVPIPTAKAECTVLVYYGALAGPPGHVTRRPRAAGGVVRIVANDLHVNCQFSGPERAPLVVLSHSLASSGRMWEQQVPALVDGYRVLRYDTRGHGGSDAPAGPYTLDDLGDDVIAMLDALDIERVHWIGLSMGGMIGQNLALRYPQRLLSLVLCDTTSRIPEPARPIWDERIAVAEKNGMQPLCSETMERWFTPPFLAADGPELQAIREQFLYTPTSGYVGCCQAIRELDYTGQLAKIALPVQLIVGAEDPSTPPEASRVIQREIAGAALTVIDNGSHLCNVEQPTAFNRALIGFLEQV
jgi:3-oxoadipate enol-lactonase